MAKLSSLNIVLHFFQYVLKEQEKSKVETKNNASLLTSLAACQAVLGCHQEEIIRGEWDSNDFSFFIGSIYGATTYKWA